MKHLLSMAIVVLLGIVSLGLGVAGAASPHALAVATPNIQCDLNNLYTPSDYYRCILYYELKPSTPQRYYLTKDAIYDGAHALSACISGFHMANISEIAITAGLLYLQDANVAFTAGDLGSGGPASVFGYIRTAETCSTVTNCSCWTSASQSQNGNTGAFVNSSLPPAIAFGPSISCNSNYHVWCVEDIQ